MLTTQADVIAYNARNRLLAQAGLPPGFEFRPGTHVVNAPIQGGMRDAVRRVLEAFPGLSVASGARALTPEQVHELRSMYGGGL